MTKKIIVHTDIIKIMIFLSACLFVFFSVFSAAAQEASGEIPISGIHFIPNELQVSARQLLKFDLDILSIEPEKSTDRDIRFEVIDNSIANIGFSDQIVINTKKSGTTKIVVIYNKDESIRDEIPLIVEGRDEEFVEQFPTEQLSVQEPEEIIVQPTATPIMPMMQPTETPKSLSWMCINAERSAIQGEGCAEYCMKTNDGIPCFIMGGIYNGPTATPSALAWMCTDIGRSIAQGDGCEEYCHLYGNGAPCYSRGNLYNFPTSTPVEIIHVKSVQLTQTNFDLKIGERIKANIIIEPQYASNKNIIWSVSDESVFHVNSDGIIEGMSTGEGSLTACSEDGNICSSASVKVDFDTVTELQWISIGDAPVEVSVGDVVHLKVTYYPEKAYPVPVRWVNSDESVIKIDAQKQDALAVGPGTANLVAQTTDGRLFASLTIRVYESTLPDSADKQNSEANVIPSDMPYLLQEVSENENENLLLSEDDTNKNLSDVESGVEETSRDYLEPEFVPTEESKLPASIENGQTSENDDGTSEALIQKSVSEEETYSEVEVLPDGTVNDISAEPTEDVISESLQAETIHSPEVEIPNGIIPEGMTSQVSQESVITVEPMQEVTVSSLPETAILTNIQFTQNRYTVFLGQRLSTSFILTPMDAEFPNLIWTVSDSSMFSVDSSGTIVGLKVGSGVLSACVADSGLCAQTFVDVTYDPAIKVEWFDIVNPIVSLKAGEKAPIYIRFYPEKAAPIAIKWSSSDETVATIDNATNEIIAFRPGNVTLFAQSLDGTKFASCSVTVLP